MSIAIESPTLRALPTPLAPRRPLTLKRVLEPAPFIVAHLLPLGALWSGATAGAWWLCLGLWLVRMFFITAGYHRYFAHKSYATSRAFQLVLAIGSQMSGQRGVLWWAAHHRQHHKHSDTDRDPHSSRRGFWHAHLGWLYTPGADDTEIKRVRDLARFPELRFLDRFWWLPSVALGAVILALGGWGMFFVGFCLCTVITWHTTFLVNSLAHVMGRQRYATGDKSRNSFILALLTLGEGWHNNHHHDMNAVRQGRRWYEIDITWYVLLVLERLGLVWDLKRPRPEPSAAPRAR